MAGPGVEIATAYVSLVPTTRGIGGQLSREFGNYGDQAGESFNRSWSSRLGGLVRTATKTGAAIGTAIGAATLTKGFQRLQAFEEADKRMESMGLSAEASERLMSKLNDTLTGTPYALDTGATAMTGFVSAGVGLDRIPGLMDMVTDAAAFGQAPLEEVAQIFQRIEGAGRVTGRELQMLADRNIPAYSLLADTMGVTEGEVRKLASEGKISAQEFTDAWAEGAKGFGESGIVIEGAAQSAGETVRGSWGNMMAALGRVGAEILEPIYERLPDLIGGVTEQINGIRESIGPMIESAIDGGQRIGEMFGDLAESEVGLNTMERFESIWAKVSTAASDAWPSIRRIGEALARAVAEVGISTWEILLATLDALATLLNVAVVPMLEGLADFMEAHPGLVTAVVAAWTAWRVGTIAWAAAAKAAAAVQWALNAAMSANPITLVVIALAALVAAVYLAYQNVGWFRDAVDAVARFLTGTLWPAVQRVAAVFGDVLGAAIDFVVDVFNDYLMPVFEAVAWVVTEVVVPAIRGLVSWFVDTLLPALWSVIDFLTTPYQVAFQVATTAIGWVIDRAGDLWSFFNDSIMPILRTVVGYFEGAWDTAFSAASTAVGWVSSAAETLLGWFWRAIEGAEGVADFLGFGGAFRKAARWAKDAVQWIVDKVQDLLAALGEVPEKAQDAFDAIAGWIPEPRKLPGGKAQPGGWRQQVEQLHPSNWWPFAEGGYVSGGVPGKDSVPALLMPGEYVLRKSAVDQLGPTVLEALNRGDLPGFADGGGVGGNSPVTWDPSAGTVVDAWADAVLARLTALPGEINAATVPQLAAWAARLNKLLADLTAMFGAQTAAWLNVLTVWTTTGRSQIDAFAAAVSSSLRTAGDGWVTGMASTADRLVGALTSRLSQGRTSLAGIVRGYAADLAEAINPILEAVGEQRVRFAKGGAVERFAGGGFVSGGVPGRDSVPALLMPGEVVIRKASVDRYGLDNLLALNEGQVPGFARGGVVGRTGNPTIDNLHPLFLAAWNAYNASQGNRFSITSGWRDTAAQARLYARWMAGVPGQAQAARPGSSNHEFGLAIDHSPHSTAATRAAAARFDLRYPMSFEPWHIEPNNARAMRDGFAMSLPEPPKIDRKGLLSDAAAAAMAHAHDRANEWMTEAFTATWTTGGEAGAEQAGSWIRAAMAATGVPDSWFTGLMTIARRESNFDPSAINRWDSNARRGTPSIGLMQTIQPTFDAHKLPGMGDIRNPIHNAAAAIRYIQARYGDISRVQQANPMASPRGYHDGGFVHARNFDAGGVLRPGWNLVRNDTGADEPVRPHRDGPLFGDVHLHDGADVDLLFGKARFALAAGGLG